MAGGSGATAPPDGRGATRLACLATRRHGRRPRALLNGQRKALESLGLDEHATPEQVKAQYKALVKRFHPDANGGSRAMEDRFREIIQAYDRLKSSGFC